MKITCLEVLAHDQITMIELKAALRVTGTGHDGELQSVLCAARDYIENVTDTTIGLKRWKVETDYEQDEDTLPRGPVVEMEEEGYDKRYKYTYTAGFAGGEIPYSLKRAILLQAKRIYDNDDLSADISPEISRLIFANTRQP